MPSSAFLPFSHPFNAGPVPFFRHSVAACPRGCCQWAVMEKGHLISTRYVKPGKGFDCLQFIGSILSVTIYMENLFHQAPFNSCFLQVISNVFSCILGLKLACLEHNTPQFPLHIYRMCRHCSIWFLNKRIQCQIWSWIPGPGSRSNMVQWVQISKWIQIIPWKLNILEAESGYWDFHIRFYFCPQSQGQR